MTVYVMRSLVLVVVCLTVPVIHVLLCMSSSVHMSVCVGLKSGVRAGGVCHSPPLTTHIKFQTIIHFIWIIDIFNITCYMFIMRILENAGHKIWMYLGYKKWLGRLLAQQKYLLKHFFIMDSGVYYFKKPCEKCKCYIESNDIVMKYENK